MYICSVFDKRWRALIVRQHHYDSDVPGAYIIRITKWFASLTLTERTNERTSTTKRGWWKCDATVTKVKVDGAVNGIAHTATYIIMAERQLCHIAAVRVNGFARGKTPSDVQFNSISFVINIIMHTRGSGDVRVRVCVSRPPSHA